MTCARRVKPSRNRATSRPCARTHAHARTDTFTSITQPGRAFLYYGLVYQACAVDNQNAFLVSNGLLTRLGNQ